MPSPDSALIRVLERARDLGFLGPGAVESHLSHARAYLPALPRVGQDALVIDLGTGGGVPGLPLALWRSDLSWILVDAMAKRAMFVTSAVTELGLRADVLEMRAEAMAADPRWAHRADVVVARSLAAPAVTAEYVAPLLRVGGRAVIAEPPGGDAARWPVPGLASLGLRRGPVLFAPNATLQVLEQSETCPSRFPRRVGMAAKSPLF